MLINWAALEMFPLIICLQTETEDLKNLCRRMLSPKWQVMRGETTKERCDVQRIKATELQNITDDCWTDWTTRKRNMHTLANKISARERETAPKYYYKVSILNFRTELNWESFFWDIKCWYKCPTKGWTGNTNTVKKIKSKQRFLFNIKITLFQREEQTTWLQKIKNALRIFLSFMFTQVKNQSVSVRWIVLFRHPSVSSTYPGTSVGGWLIGPILFWSNLRVF